MKMNLILGIIMIAIAFVVFPIVLDGAATILADVNLANYTGLEAVASIAPLVVFVAMLFGGGLLTFQGVKAARSSRKARR
jgi:threonine/homoserine/homoserine lactone efflux protein